MAKDVKGNGGDILVCRQSPDAHLKSLDMYEASNRYGLKLQPFNKRENEIQIAKLILASIELKSPYRYKAYLKQIENFYNEVLFLEMDLSNIRDTGKVNIPNDCKLKQIINQNLNILPPNKSYIINKPLWQLINSETKASLIIHELLYKELKSENSEKLRFFNALMHSNSLQEFLEIEYIDLLKYIGFSSNLIQGIHLNLNKGFNFYANNTLASAYPTKYASVYLSKQRLPLSPLTKIHFFDNSRVSSLCPTKPFILTVQENQLEAFCLKTSNNFYKLEFYKTGTLKSAMIKPIVIKKLNYTLYLGHTNQRIKTFDHIKFYKNSMIKSTLNSFLIMKYNGIELKSKKHQMILFHPNGRVKNFVLSNSVSIIINGVKKQFLADSKLEFSEKGILL